MAKSRRAKACDISQAVKAKVWERDQHRCVFCGSAVNVMPNAHVIPRSDGGLGIEENVVTACTRLSENDCHYRFDNGDEEERAAMYAKARAHLKRFYPNLDKVQVRYKKYRS
jgi:hypothetical protein